MSVRISTSLGDIDIQIYTDRCPLTTKNFLKLCKMKYFNGCLFHNIQKDFTAHTGDPTGNGSDSIYKFLNGDQDCFLGDESQHPEKGSVAMASAAENFNASHFYFTLRDDLDYLVGKNTVFGEVAEGMETLNRINEAYLDEKGRPYENIRIKNTCILDDPFDDPVELSSLILNVSLEGKPLSEIGGIPNADVKPLENVLLVCKINPVNEIFVDGLSPNISKQVVRKIFLQFEPVSVEVVPSDGCGVVQFSTRASADKAIKDMHGTKISQQIIRVRELISQTDKKLLILDVNGLLGHVVGKSFTKRPHYYDFLKFCFKRFHVAIWSSRLRSNLDPVLDDLMGDMKNDLLFCWDSSHCTDTGYQTLENSNKPLVLKELRILWNKHEPHLPWRKGVFNETNTLLLDDSPSAHCSIPVPLYSRENK